LLYLCGEQNAKKLFIPRAHIPVPGQSISTFLGTQLKSRAARINAHPHVINSLLAKARWSSPAFGSPLARERAAKHKQSTLLALHYVCVSELRRTHLQIHFVRSINYQPPRALSRKRFIPGDSNLRARVSPTQWRASRPPTDIMRVCIIMTARLCILGVCWFCGFRHTLAPIIVPKALYEIPNTDSERSSRINADFGWLM